MEALEIPEVVHRGGALSGNKISASDIVGETYGRSEDKVYRFSGTADEDQTYAKYLEAKPLGGEYAKQEKAIAKAVDEMKLTETEGDRVWTEDEDGNLVTGTVSPFIARYSKRPSGYTVSARVGSRTLPGFGSKDYHSPVFDTPEKARAYLKHVLVTQSSLNTQFNRHHTPNQTALSNRFNV